VSSYGESPPVVVRELQPSPTDLPSEKPILFDQIGEGLPVPAIEPAGDGQEQHPKDRHVDHGPEVISHAREKMSEMLSILRWDNTASRTERSR
jgi:hypothetical protein